MPHVFFPVSLPYHMRLKFVSRKSKFLCPSYQSFLKLQFRGQFWGQFSGQFQGQILGRVSQSIFRETFMHNVEENFWESFIFLGLQEQSLQSKTDDFRMKADETGNTLERRKHRIYIYQNSLLSTLLIQFKLVFGPFGQSNRQSKLPAMKKNKCTTILKRS